MTFAAGDELLLSRVTLAQLESKWDAARPDRPKAGPPRPDRERAGAPRSRGLKSGDVAAFGA